MREYIECVKCKHNEDCKALWSWLSETCLREAEEKDDETEG